MRLLSTIPLGLLLLVGPVRAQEAAPTEEAPSEEAPSEEAPSEAVGEDAEVVAPVDAREEAPEAQPRAPAEAAPGLPRVFVARLSLGPDMSPEEVAMISQSVLVAMRKHADRFDVIAADDVADLLEAEAQQQAAGCDAVTCATEIADALGAPQLVTGQVGRVGTTWLLTLTRTERSSLTVLGRVQLQEHGLHPDVLLGSIQGGVDQVMGGVAAAEPGISPLVWAGAAGLGIAGLAAVLGGVAHWQSFVAADEARSASTPQAFDSAKTRGEWLVGGSLLGYAVGAVAAIGGGAALALGLMGDAE
jgi:hypothetical protein